MSNARITQLPVEVVRDGSGSGSPESSSFARVTQLPVEVIYDTPASPGDGTNARITQLPVEVVRDSITGTGGGGTATPMTEDLLLRFVEENTSNIFTLSDWCATSTPYSGVNYRPQKPSISTESIPAGLDHGSEITQIRYENVTESLELILSGTADEMLYLEDQINIWFHKARERQRRGRRGNRIFIEYRPAGRKAGTAAVRSELLAGSAQFPDEPLSGPLQGKLWRVDISWTRRYFWESLTVDEAQLANGNNSYIANVGPLDVVNHDDADAGDDNWVYVTRVKGTIPTPARLRIFNYDGGASGRTKTIFIAHNLYATPMQTAGGFPHILEAESGTKGAGATSATATTDATNSNGKYNSIVWSGTGETELLDWNLSTSMLNDANGIFFRPIIRFHTAPALGASGVKIRVKLRVKVSVTAVFDTRWVTLDNNNYLQELDMLRIPPKEVPDSQFDLTLTLVAKHVDSGSHTLNIDFVQLSPMDGYRVLESPAYSLDQNWILWDDMIDDIQPYVEIGAGGEKVGNFVARGSKIMLDPNRDQRLYFLHRTDSGTAAITRKLAIQVYYRARSLSPYIFDIANFP